jgi:hypothetical protein
MFDMEEGASTTVVWCCRFFLHFSEIVSHCETLRWNHPWLQLQTHTADQGHHKQRSYSMEFW